MKPKHQFLTAMLKNPRTGSVLVLAAVLITVILAFCAFSIDCGYLSLVKAELQNAAEAAALASANSFSDTGTGTDFATHVRMVAKEIGGKHRAGSKTPHPSSWIREMQSRFLSSSTSARFLVGALLLVQVAIQAWNVSAGVRSAAPRLLVDSESWNVGHCRPNEAIRKNVPVQISETGGWSS